MMAVSFQLFGFQDWAARIPAAHHGAVEVRPVYVDPEEVQL